MKRFFAFLFRAARNAVHDDSLRANQFSAEPRLSPYAASMLPRLW